LAEIATPCGGFPIPVDRPTTLEELRAAGLVTPPVETAGTVSDLIDDQRR
jgi:hypothetical protein